MTEALAAVGGLGQVTAAGILAFAVILLMTGGLVSRREHESRMADMRRLADQNREDARTWRESWMKAEEGRRLATEVVEELTTGLDTLTTLLADAKKGSPPPR